jgi:sugar phosphate isomerase/epimerase
MKVTLGVKSDIIERRYSFDWLFGIMADCGVERLQFGCSLSTYLADDEYFRNLRRRAERRGILITSVFSALREFGGLASGDPLLEAATRRMWERLIHVASLLGAGMAGTNASITMRDRPESREEGIRRFRSEIRKLMAEAKREGLAALTTEPMSSVWEYPSTPEEIRGLAGELAGFHAEHAETTVPFYYCGDISHGVADRERRVVHDNWRLFELEIPWMGEFHFKNTDAIFNSTFGFGPGERSRGIVDLARLAALIEVNSDRFPLPEVTGYLEIPGPKLGRDYTDCHVGDALAESIAALKEHFR